MKILAIYSNKGGVGKTAAAVNLAYLAAQAGAKTLICDLDPQSSATYYFRVKPKLKAKAQGLAKSGKWIDHSIKGTDYQNLDLLPGDLTHRSLDITFDQLKHSTHRLERIIEPFKNEYDLVILDSPATINLLAENILSAADYVLVPLIPTTLSVRTHQQLLVFCKKHNYDTGKIYTFFSLVDQRKKMHRELMESISATQKRVLADVIPYSSVVERMGMEREPVAAFAPRSVAAQAYENLWAEINEQVLAT